MTTCMSRGRRREAEAEEEIAVAFCAECSPYLTAPASEADCVTRHVSICPFALLLLLLLRQSTDGSFLINFFSSLADQQQVRQECTRASSNGGGMDKKGDKGTPVFLLSLSPTEWEGERVGNKRAILSPL